MALPKLKNDSFTTVSATGAIDGIYDIYFIDASSGAVTVTLPSAAAVLLGRTLLFKRIDNTGNTVTVQRAGSDTIDGATSLVVGVTNIVLLTNNSLTTWRSFRFDGAVATSSFTTVSATGAIDASVDTYFVDATGGAITITLPLASAIPVSRMIRLKRIDNTTNVVTVQRAGADTIDGGTAVTMDVTDILGLMTVSTTAWRSFRYEGNPLSVSMTTVTATGAIDGSFDLYLINIGADATITLPLASSLTPGRKLTFRRIDTANFAATIARAGADTITITNSTTATSTTINSSDSFDLVRTSTTAYTVVGSRPAFKSWILTADAPVTVTTNYDVWVAPTLGADRAFTLPLAASVASGRTISFSNTSAANNIVLTRSGADVINAASLTFNVAANTGRTIVSNGVSAWYVF